MLNVSDCAPTLTVKPTVDTSLDSAAVAPVVGFEDDSCDVRDTLGAVSDVSCSAVVSLVLCAGEVTRLVDCSAVDNVVVSVAVVTTLPPALTASDLTADEVEGCSLVLPDTKTDEPYVPLADAASEGPVVAADDCDCKPELSIVRPVLTASLESTELALLFALSDETEENSDVVCSCDNSSDVLPNVDDSEVPVTLELPGHTDSDAPVSSSDAVRVGSEATVVSETSE